MLGIDRLLGNPHAQPPQPSDWQIRPTHPVHNVPYYLAPLWDAGYAKQNAARKEREQRAKKNETDVAAATQTAGKVPKELRKKLKRSKAAKGMLQDLEKEVRSFVEKWEIKCKRMEEDGIIEPDSEEEDEIVFIGRNGEMHDMPSSPGSSDEILELEREKLVFDSLEGDLGAGFGYAFALPTLTFHRERLANTSQALARPLPRPVLRSQNLLRNRRPTTRSLRGRQRGQAENRPTQELCQSPSSPSLGHGLRNLDRPLTYILIPFRFTCLILFPELTTHMHYNRCESLDNRI